MSPSGERKNTQRGYIIPIGGAEDKFHNPEILDRFIIECGGKDARIAIIPTASELPDTGPIYEKLFRKIGIKHAAVLPIFTRNDANDPEHLDYINKSDGVFMTGATSCACRPPWAARKRLSPSGAAMLPECTLQALRRAPLSCPNT